LVAVGAAGIDPVLVERPASVTANTLLRCHVRGLLLDRLTGTGAVQPSKLGLDRFGYQTSKRVMNDRARSSATVASEAATRRIMTDDERAGAVRRRSRS
jgi:hypothetical protein